MRRNRRVRFFLRHGVDSIVSTCIVSADIMCITADLAAVNTGRIIQEIKRHSRPLPSHPPSARVGGAGGGRL